MIIVWKCIHGWYSEIWAYFIDEEDRACWIVVLNMYATL